MNHIAFWILICAALITPCTAANADDVLARNTATARRVFEEGLSQGKFDVPYTDDFVGHGGSRKFTHAQDRARRTVAPVDASAAHERLRRLFSRPLLVVRL